MILSLVATGHGGDTPKIFTMNFVEIKYKRIHLQRKDERKYNSPFLFIFKII